MKKTVQAMALIAATVGLVTVPALAGDSQAAAPAKVKGMPYRNAIEDHKHCVGTPVPTPAFFFFRNTLFGAYRAYYKLKRS